MSPNEWVTIASFSSPELAAQAKHELEAEGIAVQLGDQEIMAVAWLTWNEIGSALLSVPAEQVESAVEWLQEYYPEDVRLISDTIDEAELERQALAEPAEDDESQE
jgi:hypothetical protein